MFLEVPIRYSARYVTLILTFQITKFFMKTNFNRMTMIAILAFTVCLFFSGCGKGGLVVYPANGKLLYNGQPLGGAQISFYPKDSTGVMAAAITNSDETFSLLTAGADKSGAVVGEYNVLAEKIITLDANGEPIKLAESQVPPTPKAPQWEASVEPQDNLRPTMKSVLPAKYAQIDKPLLNATVSTKQLFVWAR
ncbi:MAG: hypothetical protein LBF88_12325 [Planctomycetaceae bacterium]|jgi:hypothetical protein|nr:hypothetical protein [Planctomycetaceae bacterium]